MDEIMAGQVVALREQMVSIPPEVEPAQMQQMPPGFGMPMRGYMRFGPGMPGS
jgi:hypothetical protein